MAAAAIKVLQMPSGCDVQSGVSIDRERAIAGPHRGHRRKAMRGFDPSEHRSYQQHAVMEIKLAVARPIVPQCRHRTI
jgi:hypothetical protein